MVRGVRERVGGRALAVDLLGQVNVITADLLTLDDRIDLHAATLVLVDGATLPPRDRIQVSTIGYLDGSDPVRPVRAARTAGLRGIPVSRAAGEPLRRSLLAR